MVEAEPWIGIDLGTCNSCVGFWLNGRPEILQNIESEHTTPSVVTFKDDRDWRVGKSAVNLSLKHPENTIYDSKRLLGKTFDNKNV